MGSQGCRCVAGCVGHSLHSRSRSYPTIMHATNNMPKADEAGPSDLLWLPTSHTIRAISMVHAGPAARPDNVANMQVQVWMCCKQVSLKKSRLTPAPQWTDVDRLEMAFRCRRSRNRRLESVPTAQSSSGNCPASQSPTIGRLALENNRRIDAGPSIDNRVQSSGLVAWSVCASLSTSFNADLGSIDYLRCL